MDGIALYTGDMELYHRLARLFHKAGIPVTTLEPGRVIPEQVRLVITGALAPLEPGATRVLVVPQEIDPGSILPLSLLLASGENAFERLVVGIDPGPRPGVALYGDAELLTTSHPSSPEEAVTLVSTYFTFYPHRTFLVRIGHQAITDRNRLLNGLINEGYDVELVDESSTSIHCHEPDRRAAMTIARSVGVPFIHRIAVEPTSGEVRDLQRKSRISSDGAVTISRELARRVAKGEITMEEALTIQGV